MASVELHLPYSLEVSDLSLEPNTAGSDLKEELERLTRLYDNEFWMQKEAGVERILRAAVALTITQPEVSLAAALHTAMIWECG